MSLVQGCRVIDYISQNCTDGSYISHIDPYFLFVSRNFISFFHVKVASASRPEPAWPAHDEPRRTLWQFHSIDWPTMRITSILKSAPLGRDTHRGTKLRKRLISIHLDMSMSRCGVAYLGVSPRGGRRAEYPADAAKPLK